MREEIQVAYAQVLPYVDIAVNLLISSKRQIAVMGEVGLSGVFDTQRPVSPMAAIAMAGGFKDSARKKQVLLVHIERDGSLTVRTLNLKEAFSMDDPSAWSVKVRPFDLVYVPKSRIATVNLFVKQYITDLIPINFYIGASFQLFPQLE